MDRTIVGVVTMTVLIGAYGCSGPFRTESTPAAAPNANETQGEHADHDHSANGVGDGQAMTDREKMKSQLATLSPVDAASAEEQHVCPVSGEMLGLMGAPIKVGVGERQVWICCEGCRDQLLANPDEYLAKLRS